MILNYQNRLTEDYAVARGENVDSATSSVNGVSHSTGTHPVNVSFGMGAFSAPNVTRITQDSPGTHPVNVISKYRQFGLFPDSPVFGVQHVGVGLVPVECRLVTSSSEVLKSTVGSFLKLHGPMQSVTQVIMECANKILIIQMDSGEQPVGHLAFILQRVEVELTNDQKMALVDATIRDTFAESQRRVKFVLGSYSNACNVNVVSRSCELLPKLCSTFGICHDKLPKGNLYHNGQKVEIGALVKVNDFDVLEYKLLIVGGKPKGKKGKTTNPPPPPKPKNKTKKQNKQASKPASKGTVSRCVYKQLWAIADPSSVNAAGSCIPDENIVSSDKRACEFEIQGSTGVNNIGVIWVVGGLANNSASILYTGNNNTFTPGSNFCPFTAVNTLATGVAIAQPTSLPYNVSAFKDVEEQVQIAGRINSMQVEVEFDGTQLNKGGRIYCYQDIDHMSVSGMSITDIGNRRWKKSERWDKPCKLVITPINNLECNPQRANMQGQVIHDINSIYPFSAGDADWNTIYQTAASFTYSQNTVNVGIPIGIIVIQSAVAQMPFNIKVTQNCEFTGLLAITAGTPNPLDINGAKLALRAAKEMIKSNTTDGKARFREVMGIVTRLLKEVEPIAINVLKSYV